MTLHSITNKMTVISVSPLSSFKMQLIQCSTVATHHQCSASSSIGKASQTDGNQTTPPSLHLVDGNNHLVMKRMIALQECMSLTASDA